MSIFKEVLFLDGFKRDLKHLLKKFRTLNEDLDNFIETQLKMTHKLGIDNDGVEQISNLGIEYPRIYKARKFACKSLKGTGCKSGIRIIYSFHSHDDKIVFIEIYYKGEKENESGSRIKEYIKSLS